MSTAAERIYSAVGIPSTSHGQLNLLSVVFTWTAPSSSLCNPLPTPTIIMPAFVSSSSPPRLLLRRLFPARTSTILYLSRPLYILPTPTNPSQCNCIRRFLSFSLPLGDLVFDDHMTTATTTIFLYREGVPTTTTTTTIARHMYHGVTSIIPLTRPLLTCNRLRENKHPAQCPPRLTLLASFP